MTTKVTLTDNEVTGRFVTEIPLKVTDSQESALNKRFEAARKAYNACLDECQRRLMMHSERRRRLAV